MKVVTMIEPAKRKTLRCHFCNTDKSVKYLVEISDPITNQPTQIHCCNKCYALSGKGNSVNWSTLTGAEQITMHELCEKE
jgi:hypothetical protein